MPLIIDVDPDDEHIEKLRRGEEVQIQRVTLAGTEYEVFHRFALKYKPTGDEPAWRMVFDASDGVPRCVSFTIEKTESGREIRSVDLRLSVEDALEMSTRSIAGRSVMPSYEDVRSGATLRAVRSARRTGRRKVTDDLLREVAEIYRREVDSNPSEAIAAHLGIADRTARLYVRRARDAGFLGKALRGKAGER